MDKTPDIRLLLSMEDADPGVNLLLREGENHHLPLHPCCIYLLRAAFMHATLPLYCLIGCLPPMDHFWTNKLCVCGTLEGISDPQLTQFK